MINFTCKTEKIQTDAITLEFFLVPWDSEILEQPVAEISRIEVRDAGEAGRNYLAFRHWCEQHHISLCSCRVEQDRLLESRFLEAQGFHIVELNYRPYLKKLSAFELLDDEIKVETASEKDRETLADMAGSVFQYGRFHQDPRLGPTLGNRRYRMWLLNSFEQAHQRVLKCVSGGEIIAFFVVEYPEQHHCFWSLTGLAAGKQGRGLGTRVWRTMLAWHRNEGIDIVSTSISSHNIAVFNLYVSLGFRFPAPQMTFHWRPAGVSR